MEAMRVSAPSDDAAMSWSTRSVWMYPGQTALMRIPSGLSSSANVLIIPITAGRIEFDNNRFPMGCLTDMDVL
jgi:hypothetical protein